MKKKQTKIFTVAVQKGGTGKTTTASAIAQAGVFSKMKTLAIDLDPQGNFSFTLGAQIGSRGATDFLNGETDAIQTLNEYLDVVPAQWSLSAVTSSKGSARRLQKALELVKDNYELIVIDTPPTAGELQYNALQASTDLIIPLEADIYNIQSLYQITDTAKQIQTSNPQLNIAGIILTKYNDRSTLNKQMKEATITNADNMGIPFLGTIRSAVAVREAAAMQTSLFEYAPKSKPAHDYMAIFEAITK